MADWGIKVSSANQDIGTAVDKKLLFITKLNIFKTTTQGSIDLVIPSGSSFSGTTQIGHNLGYSPMYFLYVKATDGEVHMAQTENYEPGTATYKVKRSVYSWTDGTNLSFYINFGTAGTYSAYYYIFYDPV